MNNIIHVSTLIDDSNGNILLVKEGKDQSYGKYNLPGGHLEENESLLDGAKREVKEETGLNIKIEYMIGIYTGYRKDVRLINYVFYGNTNNTNVKPQNNEILECKWIALSEILNMNEDIILNRIKLLKILEDYKKGNKISVSIINENIY